MQGWQVCAVCPQGQYSSNVGGRVVRRVPQVSETSPYMLNLINLSLLMLCITLFSLQEHMQICLILERHYAINVWQVNIKIRMELPLARLALQVQSLVHPVKALVHLAREGATSPTSDHLAVSTQIWGTIHMVVKVWHSTLAHMEATLMYTDQVLAPACALEVNQLIRQEVNRLLIAWYVQMESIRIH